MKAAVGVRCACKHKGTHSEVPALIRIFFGCTLSSYQTSDTLSCNESLLNEKDECTQTGKKHTQVRDSGESHFRCLSCFPSFSRRCLKLKQIRNGGKYSRIDFYNYTCVRGSWLWVGCIPLEPDLGPNQRTPSSESECGITHIHS